MTNLSHKYDCTSLLARPVGLWCKGNAVDFQSGNPGSIPSCRDLWVLLGGTT